jgi:hypothetical protein
VWALCLAGQLVGYRAGLVADLARDSLDQPAQLARLAERITVLVGKHLRGVPGLRDEDGVEVPPLVGRTPRHLRDKLSYEIRKLRSAEAEERHRRARAARAVRSADLEDGMGHLGITGTVDRVGRAPGGAVHPRLPAHPADLAVGGGRVELLLPARL